MTRDEELAAAFFAAAQAVNPHQSSQSLQLSQGSGGFGCSMPIAQYETAMTVTKVLHAIGAVYAAQAARAAPLTEGGGHG